MQVRYYFNLDRFVPRTKCSEMHVYTLQSMSRLTDVDDTDKLRLDSLPHRQGPALTKLWNRSTVQQKQRNIDVLASVAHAAAPVKQRRLYQT